MQAMMQDQATGDDSAGDPVADRDTALPTAPCSVVWSGGHAYVLEGPGVIGTARWVGLDDRGRPRSLAAEDLRRRGWSRYPA